MEQNSKKTTFEEILKDCISNPDRQVDLSPEHQEVLKKTNEAIDLIESNWNELNDAHIKGQSTLEWAEQKYNEKKQQYGR